EQPRMREPFSELALWFESDLVILLAGDHEHRRGDPAMAGEANAIALRVVEEGGGELAGVMEAAQSIRLLQPLRDEGVGKHGTACIRFARLAGEGGEGVAAGARRGLLSRSCVLGGCQTLEAGAHALQGGG